MLKAGASTNFHKLVQIKLHFGARKEVAKGHLPGDCVVGGEKFCVGAMS